MLCDTNCCVHDSKARRAELNFRADASKLGQQHRAGSLECRVCLSCAHAQTKLLAQPWHRLLSCADRTEGGIGAAPKGAGV